MAYNIQQIKELNTLLAKGISYTDTIRQIAIMSELDVASFNLQNEESRNKVLVCA